MNNNFYVNFDENFLCRVFSKVVSFFKNQFYIVNLKKISSAERKIIKKYYNNILSEYSLDYVSLAENDITYPIILKLVKRNILVKLNEFEKIDNYDGYGVKYKLTKKAWKKLNRRKYIL